VIVSQSIAFARHETKVSPRVKGAGVAIAETANTGFRPGARWKNHIFFLWRIYHWFIKPLLTTNDIPILIVP
jgi:hypothetical protein